MIEPEPFRATCRDGYVLHGHLWSHRPRAERGTVIVNPATGVLARYYHRYARFLAEHEFTVVTYDYRGVGASRPATLRGSGIRWRDWGELDFDAVVEWSRARAGGGPLAAVGHSIGGFVAGLAPAAVHLDRLLTVGAQYAYWRDYAAGHRSKLLLKWHVAMPITTSLLGYFPGRRLGWLEDLPVGVAHEWSFRKRRFESSFPAEERATVIARFAAVRASILAIGVTDDEFGTRRAIRRGLDYYTSSERTHVTLAPHDLGFDRIGHFDLFHARHREGFWTATAAWLTEGRNPWPSHEVPT